MSGGWCLEADVWWWSHFSWRTWGWRCRGESRSSFRCLPKWRKSSLYGWNWSNLYMENSLFPPLFWNFCPSYKTSLFLQLHRGFPEHFPPFDLLKWPSMTSMQCPSPVTLIKQLCSLLVPHYNFSHQLSLLLLSPIVFLLSSPIVFTLWSVASFLKQHSDFLYLFQY